MPPEPDGTESKWPGAANGVELFAQVIWAGVLTALAGFPIITLPAAIAAGTRHLQRYLRAERSSVRNYGADFVRALPGGLVVGVMAVLVAGLLGLNIFLSLAQVLFAWPVILVLGVLGLALTVLILLQAGYHWTPDRGWKGAIAEGARKLRDDPIGGVMIVAVLAVSGVVIWLLPPLIVAAVGCLLFTVLTVNVRQRRI
ncbi:hypothetical protein [Arthrobacter flavus]|uniref:DUF624 domain-containing protein n=1 Tax=Arthrobacter flavus TaxID=95172 RepID=A0ABW4Q4Y6_9MICC